MKTNELLKTWKAFWARTALIGVFLLTGLISFGHGVQLRWNIVPSTGAIRVWVEHWHGQATNVSNYPLVISYTVAGVTTQQTYYATGIANSSTVAQLPDGGNLSTLLSSCSGYANTYNNWVYWDFNPPACNTPVSLTIVAGTAVETTEACPTLYPQTIYSSFNDNSGPAITANDIIVAPTDTSDCSALVSSFGVTAVDACGGPSTTTYSIAEGTVFQQGSTPVTVTSTDGAGNVSTSTFNVTVGDVQPPTVVTQDLTVTLSSGNVNITAAQIENGSYDNACGGIASYSVSPSSFDCFDVGENTVTLSVTDIFGNIGTGTATVTVLTDLVVSATPTDVSCYGECNGSVALNISGGSAPYTIVTDELNYTFDGTSIDNNLFTYSGNYVQNGTLSTDPLVNTYWNTNIFRTTATMDRVDGKSFEFKYLAASRSLNLMGWYGTNSQTGYNHQQNFAHCFYFSNTYLYVYEDGSFNSLSTPFSLTDNQWYDCKIELKSAGANYYIKSAGAANYTLVLSTSGSSESNLSPGMLMYGYTYYTGNDQTDDWLVGSGGAGTSTDTTNLCAGNYVMTVKDANGCITDVSYTINEPSSALTSSIAHGDSACMDENYSISAGNTFGGTAPYSYSWDMGDGSTVTGSTANHVYTSLGIKNITLTVSDANGCSETYISSTFVEQCNVPPVAVCQNITVSTDANCQAVVAAMDVDGGSTDANGDVMSFAMSPSGPFPVGVHNVTLTVSDPLGASSQCMATITVEDNTAPLAVAQGMTVQLVNGAASITAQDIDNGSSDACGIASMTLSEDSWTCGDIGNHSVTLTVTDNNGNSSSSDVIVSVVGQIPTCSIASLPSNNTYTGGVSTTLYLGYGAQSTTLSCTATGGNSFTYAWTGTGLSSTTSANPVFTPTGEGIYNFSVVVTNENGCETSCSITICVRDIRVYKKGKVQKNKVYLCHAPPGNPSNTQTLSVSVNAVASHLSNHAGDALGTCGASCGDLSTASKTGPTGNLFSEEFNGQDVDVILYPNPSTDFFSVMVESDMDDFITVELYDMAGNLIERLNGQLTYHQIEMGRDLASGMYMVVVTQGEYRKVIKASRTK